MTTFITHNMSNNVYWNAAPSTFLTKWNNTAPKWNNSNLPASLFRTDDNQVKWEVHPIPIACIGGSTFMFSSSNLVLRYYTNVGSLCTRYFPLETYTGTPITICDAGVDRSLLCASISPTLSPNDNNSNITIFADQFCYTNIYGLFQTAAFAPTHNQNSVADSLVTGFYKNVRSLSGTFCCVTDLCSHFNGVCFDELYCAAGAFFSSNFPQMIGSMFTFSVLAYADCAFAYANLPAATFACATFGYLLSGSCMFRSMAAPNATLACATFDRLTTACEMFGYINNISPAFTLDKPTFGCITGSCSAYQMFRNAININLTLENATFGALNGTHAAFEMFYRTVLPSAVLGNATFSNLSGCCSAYGMFAYSNMPAATLESATFRNVDSAYWMFAWAHLPNASLNSVDFYKLCSANTTNISCMFYDANFGEPQLSMSAHNMLGSVANNALSAWQRACIVCWNGTNWYKCCAKFKA